MSDTTEEREVKDELQTVAIDAPAPPAKQEPEKEEPEPEKESRPQLVLHKFEKAASKKYHFDLTVTDLALFGAGVLCLAIAAYFYGRASVEIAENAG
jgi:hypothetical protein